MNHAKNIAGVALAALILSGCASSGGTAEAPSAKATTSGSATEATYMAALGEAKISLQKAKKAHYVWRDSGKILKKADKAAKEGDFKKATKLALQAKRQGELALKQSKDQAKAGPRLN